MMTESTHFSCNVNSKCISLLELNTIHKLKNPPQWIIEVDNTFVAN